MEKLKWVFILIMASIITFLVVNLMPTLVKVLMEVAFFVVFFATCIWVRNCIIEDRHEKTEAFKAFGFMIWIIISPFLVNVTIYTIYVTLGKAGIIAF